MQSDFKLSPPLFIQDTSSLMARVEAYELQRQVHLEHIRAQIQDTELEECSFAPRVRKTRKAPQVWPECLSTFSSLSFSTLSCMMKI